MGKNYCGLPEMEGERRNVRSGFSGFRSCSAGLFNQGKHIWMEKS